MCLKGCLLKPEATKAFTRRLLNSGEIISNLQALLEVVKVLHVNKKCTLHSGILQIERRASDPGLLRYDTYRSVGIDKPSEHTHSLPATHCLLADNGVVLQEMDRVENNARGNTISCVCVCVCVCAHAIRVSVRLLHFVIIESRESSTLLRGVAGSWLEGQTFLPPL